MGITERHWFEDEEPKLTEQQLEDIIAENQRSYEKGYADAMKNAVPLDKLCEWLAKYSVNIPCEFCPYLSNNYCIAIGKTIKPCLNSAHDWRQAITKWMERLDATN